MTTYLEEAQLELCSHLALLELSSFLALLAMNAACHDIQLYYSLIILLMMWNLIYFLYLKSKMFYTGRILQSCVFFLDLC